MTNLALLHLVRLARRLNKKAQAETAPPPTFSEWLKDFEVLTSIGYKFLLFVGVTSTVGYLIASIQFYPAGVTIGDAFFFLMVAMAFGFAYVLFLMFGFALAALIKALVCEPTSLKMDVVRVLAVYALMAIAIVFIGYWDCFPAQLVLSALFGFGLAGGLMLYLVDRAVTPVPVIVGPTTASSATAPPLSGWWVQCCAWFIALFLPLILSTLFVQRINENVAMPRVGLRTMGVTLKLSEENYDILSSAANGQYLAALGCRTSAGAPDRTVHGVNLLWHGVGERTLVEIPSKARDNLTVELKREGVFSFRHYTGDVERCLELEGDLLFESASSELPKANRDLKEMLEVIQQNKDDIKEIQVVGHADAFGYKGGAERNNQLALARASAVMKKIQECTAFDKTKVKAEEHGAREPKTLCKDWPVKATLSECLAVNRRVEVRMKFNDGKVEKSCPSNAEKDCPKQEVALLCKMD